MHRDIKPENIMIDGGHAVPLSHVITLSLAMEYDGADRLPTPRRCTDKGSLSHRKRGTRGLERLDTSWHLGGWTWQCSRLRDPLSLDSSR